MDKVKIFFTKHVFLIIISIILFYFSLQNIFDNLETRMLKYLIKKFKSEIILNVTCTFFIKRLQFSKDASGYRNLNVHKIFNIFFQNHKTN